MIFSATGLQYCCDIVSNGYSIIPTLQRCVGAKKRRCELSRVTSLLKVKLSYSGYQKFFSRVQRLSSTKMLQGWPQAEEAGRKSFSGGSV